MWQKKQKRHSGYSDFFESMQSPWLLLGLTVFCLLIILVSIFLEYQARERDYYRLLEKQAVLLINTVKRSTQSAITAAASIEEEMNSRLLAHLRLMDEIDFLPEETGKKQKTWILETNIQALFIYDAAGNLKFSLSKDTKMVAPIPDSDIQSWQQSASGDTVITWIDQNNPTQDRLIARVRRQQGGFIIAVVGDEQIRELKQILGIGYFLKRFQQEENIEYIVIQTSQTIVAGSFKPGQISGFSADPLLQSVLEGESIHTRTRRIEERLLFEAISPFRLQGFPFGVLRLGLSMEEVESLRKDNQRRLILFSVVLFIVGFIMMQVLATMRHRRLLSHELRLLQAYTNTILENLSSGVISINQRGDILTVNKRAGSLLPNRMGIFPGMSYTRLPDSLRDSVEQCLTPGKESFHSTNKGWINFQGEKRLLSIQTSLITEDENSKTCVLLLDDITDEMRLTEQINRNQKLTAMRNLAMSVAHEIKNPLNAIQLLLELVRKRTKTQMDDSIQNYLDTVNGEIHRISRIIEQYLRFSRPPTLNLTQISFPDLMDEVAQILGPQLRQRHIGLLLEIGKHETIHADPNLMRQVFINLIKNAEEASQDMGEIHIVGETQLPYYQIQISDRGSGIRPDDLESIFDLHFTTKENGTGIGLSVVQQIIEAHGGSISVRSVPGEGTQIILLLPFGEPENSESIE